MSTGPWTWLSGCQGGRLLRAEVFRRTGSLRIAFVFAERWFAICSITRYALSPHTREGGGWGCRPVESSAWNRRATDHTMGREPRGSGPAESCDGAGRSGCGSESAKGAERRAGPSQPRVGKSLTEHGEKSLAVKLQLVRVLGSMFMVLVPADSDNQCEADAAA